MLSQLAHKLGPIFMAKLAETTPAAMLLFDRDLQPLECNPSFRRLTGRDIEHSPLDCLETADLQRVREALEGPDADRPVRWPGRVRGADRHWREVEFVVVRVMGYRMLVMLDVTDSRRIGRKLEALCRFSNAVSLSSGMDATLNLLAGQVVEATEVVAAAVILMEPGRKVTQVGHRGVPETVIEAALELLAAGFEAPAFLAFESGQTMLVPPEQRKAFLAGTRLGELVEKQGWLYLVCVPMGCGVINCFFHEEPLPTPDDISFLETLGRFAGVAIDNARHFKEAEERWVLEERQRLGRELHDSVSQSLYSIGLGAQAALAALDAGSAEEARQTVEYILSLAQSGLDDMRSLLLKLRPEALEDEGLLKALERQADASRVRYGMKVALDLKGEPEVSAAVRHAVYRIASEAIHNALKHSGASGVQVRLRPDGQGTLLEVVDDGRGFDPLAPSSGLGLTTMKERAHEIGANLHISSEAGRGTRLRLRF